MISPIFPQSKHVMAATLICIRGWNKNLNVKGCIATPVTSLLGMLVSC